MIFLANLILSLSMTSTLPKVSNVASFTACVDDRPWIPYTYPDKEKPGNMQILVYNASHDLKVRVDIEALPWKRCLQSVRLGRIDAVIGASDLPYLRELAEFPQLSDHLTTDSNRSLGTARIMLAKRKDSRVSWDGTTLSHLKKPVGTAMGTYAMKRAVQKYGGIADDSAYTDSQNIKKLLQDRVDLIAAYEYDLTGLIEKSFRGQLEVFPVPLIESYYFMAFSKRFYGAHKDFAELFWNKLGEFQNNSSAKVLLRQDLTLTNSKSQR